MAAVAPAVNQATDLLHKLSLDQQAKTNGASDAIKKSNVSAEGMDRTNSLAPSFERSMTPLLQDYVDPSMCYLPNGYPSGPFYYNAYDGSVADWDDYRYMNSDEMPHAGVYGDMYHHGFGYATYGAYSPGSPVPTVGHDGQLYGHQHYQYPSTYYAVNSTYAPNNPAPSSQPEIPTVSSELPTPTVDAVKPIPSNGNSKVLPSKPAAQNALALSDGPTDSRYSHNGTRSTVPWLDSATFQDGPNKGPTTSSVSSPVFHPGSNLSSRHHHGMRPFPHMMGLSSPRPNSGIGPGGPGIMNSLYPNARIYGNAYRADARGWVPVDSKYKPRGRGGSFFPYGNENIDGIGELNRGPRSGRVKVQKSPLTNITIAVKGQPLPTEGNKETSTVPDKDLYNKEDFPEEYANARFFIIKSYSEDDVHKSIKYNVWASTASGNKKLDAAYQESRSKDGACPVFLLFSVNTSGQFVGIAEMVGNVDFEKTVEYWQQDKWMGCFPVKWHIIKDVPNRILKHITLENNENKPVTNSRDTQEVKLEQGIQMLKLFKEHVSKTSILDDFIFYEARQKTMQERRAKQQQFQKQVWDEKAREVECKVRIQKPGSLAAVTKEALVELKPVQENGGGV